MAYTDHATPVQANRTAGGEAGAGELKIAFERLEAALHWAV